MDPDLKRNVDIALVLVGLAVGIILYLVPKNTSVTVVCLVTLFGLLIHPTVYLVVWLSKAKPGLIIGPICFAEIILLVAVLGFGYYVWPRNNQESALKPQKQTVTHPAETPPTLEDLFKKDFQNTMKATDESFIELDDGAIVHIKRQVYLDFDAKTKFVGFYIYSTTLPPNNTRTFQACLQLAEIVKPIAHEFLKEWHITDGFLGGDQTALEQLTFSGRVFLYHEDFLSIKQKAAIIDSYAAQKCEVQFRGLDYLGIQLMAWHAEHTKK